MLAVAAALYLEAIHIVRDPESEPLKSELSAALTHLFEGAPDESKRQSNSTKFCTCRFLNSNSDSVWSAVETSEHHCSVEIGCSTTCGPQVQVADQTILVGPLQVVRGTARALSRSRCTNSDMWSGGRESISIFSYIFKSVSIGSFHVEVVEDLLEP